MGWRHGHLRWETTNGKEIIQQLATGPLGTPLPSLLGFTLREVEDDHLVLTMPASEWFCGDSRTVSPNIIAAMANSTGWTFGLVRHRTGETFAGLDARSGGLCARREALGHVLHPVHERDAGPDER